MEKKYTPGEWQVVDDYDNYVPYSVDTPQIYIWNGDEQAHKPICDMGEMGDMNYAEEIANARLIAAAPNLLDALQEMMIGLDNIKYPENIGEHTVFNTGYVKATLEKSKAAISKALGE